MFKVAITDYVNEPASLESSVFEGQEILCLENKQLDKLDLSKVEILLVWHQEIDSKYLSYFPSLKIVVRYGVGFDNIDLSAIKDRGIIFSNTPDYGTEEVADTACAMILNASRRISFYNQACKNYSDDTWQENYQPQIKRSSKTTIGIVGVGRIGSAVISRLRMFNFKIVGFDPNQPSGHEKAIGYTRAFSLEELLTESDIVSIHCPCNKETEGMISESFIEKMKNGSSLVNTARGKILKNLDVLEKGLNSGKLESAFLDVLPTEPVDKSHSLISAWIKEDASIQGRLVINPHAAFYSESAWEEMRIKCAETGQLYVENGIIRNEIK